MDTTRPEKSTENDEQGRYLAGSGPVWGLAVPANTLNRSREIRLWPRIRNQ